MVELLKHLVNNLSYLIVIAFFISKLNTFRQMIRKDRIKRIEIFILAVVFGGIGILGTYVGINIRGAIANTRNIGVMVGGILCGPFVGIVGGILAGVHRILIDIGGITSFPCALATVMGGFLSGIIYRKSNVKNRWLYGLGGGIIVENMSMFFILVFSKPFDLALSIVKDIYVPMVLINGIGIAIVIMITENIFEAEEEIAAKQAKHALEIANKTLPYFRDVNEDSLRKVCEIIKDSVKADAVSITDRKKILAHIGNGEDHHTVGKEILTKATARAIQEGTTQILNTPKEIECMEDHCPLKSGIIVPLKENEKIIGTLKIYYKDENHITFRDISLADGLSQLISTQLEISKLEKLKEMANKSEIKALQAQINPHFLFNALNTIVSFMRLDIDKSRALIIDLSTYLRYNLEIEDELVSLNKELEQVRAYIKIEQARYGNKLNIIYDMKENIDIRIPSLTIQPLVENAIKHGILKNNQNGFIKISIKEETDKKRVEIMIEDNGVGIEEDIIQGIKNGKTKEGSIGLLNVYNRLKLIYGKGLNIERLKKGTRISFEIYRK
ncbi:sensor histidine kinase [Marinisporobacter balticus]|uniref:histidine kinase n=1 Tax=Marinisporobacter balticus TaxID=2018667 RepID=A0A4R2KWP4_9FIRM|nr:sensor histidine kinase [Marinisporobacter balticus]TCO77452.1 two-component system LytT family sensor kinase [Marinisporobacter balticus]